MLDNDSIGKKGEVVLLAAIGLFVLLYWFQAMDNSPFILIFPIMLTLVLVILLAGQLYKYIKVVKDRQKEPSKRFLVTNLLLNKRIAILLIMVISILLWNILGIFLNIVITCITMTIILGERRPWVLLLLSIIFAVFVTYIFQNLLYVPLPKGVFFYNY